MKLLKIASIMMFCLVLGQAAQSIEETEAKAADAAPIFLAKKINEVIVPGEFLSIGDLFDLESIEAIDGARIIKMIVKISGGEKALVKVNGKEIAEVKSGVTNTEIDLRWGPEISNFVMKPVGQSMKVESITLLLDHGDVEKLRKQARFERRDEESKE